MKKLCIALIALPLIGCSSVDFPKMEPMNEEEKSAFTCTDIRADINQAEGILEILNSGSAQATTGVAVGATALLAAVGGLSFDLIGTPIAHARALDKTQTRHKQLQELFEEKDCTQEEVIEAVGDDQEGIVEEVADVQEGASGAQDEIADAQEKVVLVEVVAVE